MLVYLAALLIAFSPSKALGFIGPFVIVAALILYVQLRPNFHFQRIFLVGLAYTFVGTFYWLLLPQFWWPNYFFVLITFSAGIFLLFDFSSILDIRFIRRLGRVTLLFIFLESLYGIAQFVLAIATQGYHTSIGDFVWGTLAPPNDVGYAGTSSFFVLLISTLLLFVFAVTPPKVSLYTIIGSCTVALCWVLASMIHSVVFFAFAVVAAIAVSTFVKPRRGQRKQRRGVLMVTAILILLVAVGTLVHPSNFERIRSVLSSIQTFGPKAQYGKLRFIYQTIFELPQDVWLQPVIGVGPGQYSSRAAMISTGEYLTRASIPLLPEYKSDLTEHYVMPLFYATNSTTNSPTSSWIALYGELGILGWGIFLTLLLLTAFRFGRVAPSEFPRLGYAMLILVFYLFFMGFQDVYWEYTQGIFPAVLLLKLSYDFVRLHQRARRAVYVAESTKVVVGQPIGMQPTLPGHS